MVKQNPSVIWTGATCRGRGIPAARAKAADAVFAAAAVLALCIAPAVPSSAGPDNAAVAFPPFTTRELPAVLSQFPIVLMHESFLRKLSNSTTKGMMQAAESHCG